MRIGRATLWLSLAVALLLGVVIGQFLHSRAGETSPSQPAATTAANDSATLESSRESPNALPAPPAPALSETRYWISAQVTDTEREAWSVLLHLRRGGELWIEHCVAPDYESLDEVATEEPPFLTPSCSIVDRGVVQSLDSGQIVFASRDGSKKRVGFSHTGAGAEERLVLELRGGSESLAPGQKNTISEALSNLPSVRHAHRQKLDAHERLRREARQPHAG
jgi:hypothetical protein